MERFMLSFIPEDKKESLDPCSGIKTQKAIKFKALQDFLKIEIIIPVGKEIVSNKRKG